MKKILKKKVTNQSYKTVSLYGSESGNNCHSKC